MIYTLTLGEYQTNCYIVSGTQGRCVVIDPGYDAARIRMFLAERDLACEAVLLTHGHFDHVGAVETIVSETGCALWMHEGDRSHFPNPVNAFFYPLADCDFTDVRPCGDGTQICAAGLCFSVLHTPGHTRGSVCYRCGDDLFTGDTLFCGSCGRTDLPGGDAADLRRSLARLSRLTDDVRVFPGHGQSSTLSAEKRHNPYLCTEEPV